VSAYLAVQTGFSQDDLELLWNALMQMFDHDHSAARGKMNARKLVVFKHETALGNVPAHKLFDLVTVNKSGTEPKPARAFSDYVIKIDRANVPAGVTLEEKV
jgi:CRISPR-associated protein Csd2